MSIGLGVLDAGLLPQEGLRLVIVVAVLDRFRLRPVRRGPGVTISGPVDPVSGSAVVVVVPRPRAEAVDRFSELRFQDGANSAAPNHKNKAS